MKLKHFQNMMYGEYLSSFDNKTPLIGLCHCIGRENDDEGFEWRTFTQEQWGKISHMSKEEIYNNFPAAAAI